MKHTKGKCTIQCESLDNIEVIAEHPESGIFHRIAHVADWDSRLPNYEEFKANAELIKLTFNLTQKHDPETWEKKLDAAPINLEENELNLLFLKAVLHWFNLRHLPDCKEIGF